MYLKYVRIIGTYSFEGVKKKNLEWGNLSKPITNGTSLLVINPLLFLISA